MLLIRLDIASNIFATILYVAFSYSTCVLRVMKCRYMEIPYNVMYCGFC